jgi:hypothetical protein
LVAKYPRQFFDGRLVHIFIAFHSPPPVKT